MTYYPENYHSPEYKDVLFTGIFRRMANVTEISNNIHGECHHYTSKKETMLLRELVRQTGNKYPEMYDDDILKTFGREYGIAINIS